METIWHRMEKIYQQFEDRKKLNAGYDSSGRTWKRKEETEYRSLNLEDWAWAYDGIALDDVFTACHNTDVQLYTWNTAGRR